MSQDRQTTITASIHTINQRAVRDYTPLVEEILRSRSQDKKHIERTLDGLLDFCGYEPALQLYRRLCRYYWAHPVRATKRPSSDGGCLQCVPVAAQARAASTQRKIRGSLALTYRRLNLSAMRVLPLGEGVPASGAAALPIGGGFVAQPSWQRINGMFGRLAPSMPSAPAPSAIRAHVLGRNRFDPVWF